MSPRFSSALHLGAGIFAALLMLGATCGEGPGSTAHRAAGGDDGASRFPSQQELEALPDDSRERDEAQEGDTPPAPVADVNAWTLHEPLPELIGDLPVREPNAADRVLQSAAVGRAGLVVVSDAMRCAARQAALFHLDHEALPPPGLRRFMVGRCGSTVVGGSFAYTAGRVPADVGDDELVARWSDRIGELARPMLQGGPRAAGVWLARRGEQAVAMVAAGRRRAHIQPVRNTPGEDGRLRIEGEVLSGARNVSGLANAGELAASRCELDEGMRPPAFALECPLAGGDDRSWVTLFGAQPGRVLAPAVLSVVARPSGAAAAHWARPRIGDATNTPDEASFRLALLNAVNRLRRRADAPPLALDRAQSRTATKLAGPYFAAAFSERESLVQDTVALGLMAGWEIEDLIRDADFGSNWVLDADGVDRWLGEALEHPSLRRALLSPEVTRLAVGPWLDRERKQVGALVTTYELYTDDDLVREREAMYVHMAQAFRERGHAAPTPDAELENIAGMAALRLHEGRDTRQEAVDWLLEKGIAHSGHAVSGLLLEAREVDEVRIPEDFFGSDIRRIAIGVAHYRPSDEAWGRSAFFVLTARDAPMRRVEARPGAFGG